MSHPGGNDDDEPKGGWREVVLTIVLTIAAIIAVYLWHRHFR